MERLDRYERLLKKIWKNSVKYLGFLSLKLLIERVIWDISMDYPEIELLDWDEEGFSVKRLKEKLEEGEDIPFEDMFDTFIERFVEILAKLIGKSEAERIKELLS